MKKGNLIILVLFYSSIISYSQSKEDYIWLFSNNSLAQEGKEAYGFNFNIKGPDFLEDYQSLVNIEFTGNNASICDRNGNLLFYTNGCHVADATHNIMPNGSGLNDGIWVEEFMQDTCGDYSGTQNIIILNDPGFELGYYILHKTREYDGEIFFNNIKYTYVDLELNNGLGDVTEKNIKIINDTEILSSYLTSIKHSNSLYSWIIHPVYPDKFQTILLDDQDFSNYGRQNSGAPEFQEFSSASGTASFSPDGDFYAFYNVYDNLLLYDFERETGLLSNLRQLELARVFPPNVVFSSVEWSPNSRFLYVAIQDELWQVDTWEDDLEDGKVLIDRWNGVQDPFSTIFFLMALAPDCKIYMCSTSSTNSYHVINKPNEKGTACDFVQQGIRLPFVSATATMPNFPRFRVDEDDKCDPTITSIFGDHVYYRRDMTVYPNPVRDVLKVEVPEGKKGRIVVFDMQGQLVWSDHEIDIYRDKVQLDLSGLVVGTYSVEFVPDDNRERLVFTAQVVKVE